MRIHSPVQLVRVRLLDVSRGRWVGFALQERAATRLQVDVSLDRWEMQVAARLLIEQLARSRRRFALLERADVPPTPHVVSSV